MSAGIVNRVFFPSAPPARLAALRVLIGGYAVIHFLTMVIQFWAFTTWSAHHFKPVGLAKLLGQPLSPTLWIATMVISYLAGIAYTLGWHYRISGPLFALGATWLGSYRSSWGMIFHTENLLVLHVIVIGLIPAAAATHSLDARRSSASWDMAEHPRFGWPIRTLNLITTLVYFIAGVAKLRNAGINWVTNDTLRIYIAIDNLRKVELASFHAPFGAVMVRTPGALKALAGFSLILELVSPLALLHVRAAQTWAVMIWSFHFGVLLMMMILFAYPLCGIAFLSLFQAEKIRPVRWVLRLFESRSTGPRSGDTIDDSQGANSGN